MIIIDDYDCSEVVRSFADHLHSHLSAIIYTLAYSRNRRDEMG